MLRLFQQARGPVVAAAALLCITTGQADAQVIVAEDFLYQQETDVAGTFTGANKFLTVDYAGGQNGAGTWETRWDGFGAAGIVSDDREDDPFLSNPFSASVNDSGGSGGSDLTRAYSLGTASSATTLWFGADFLQPAGDVVNMFASFNPFTVAGDARTGAVGIGIREGSFFGAIGGETMLADTGGAGNNTADQATHRLVGKLEIGAGAAVADYNGDGVTNAADYTIYRDTLGSMDDLRADGDGSGTIDQPDYDLWSASYNNKLDRLTVLIDPTDGETSGGSTLVIEGQLARTLADASSSALITGLDPDDGNEGGGRHFVDNVAVGLTFDDVAAVDVPRLSAEYNSGSGALSLVNNTGSDVEIAYYEIVSESGALNPSGWNSLQDQATSGWAENSDSAELIAESNLLEGSVLAASGGALDLGTPVGGSATDLIVRYGTLDGGEGYLSLAPVMEASATAVPEPASVALLAIAALGLARRRV